MKDDKPVILAILLAALALALAIDARAAGETNLAATVTTCIVTNVTQTDNGHAGCPYGAGCLVIGCDHSPTIQATEKTETTEVVEVKTLTFSWEGEEYNAKRERVLSRKVRRWKKHDNWVEDGQ
jgi:hypothetical protein